MCFIEKPSIDMEKKLDHIDLELIFSSSLYSPQIPHYFYYVLSKIKIDCFRVFVIPRFN